MVQGSRTTTRQGESAHPALRRAGRGAPAAAHGQDREELHFRWSARPGQPPRPVRRARPAIAPILRPRAARIGCGSTSTCSTSHRSAARRNGRTHPRGGRNPHRTFGGASTMNTATSHRRNSSSQEGYMTTRTEYAHGEFSWVELATTDLAAAKRFYGRLFGSQAADMPAGPGMTYTMTQPKTHYTAGLYALD